MIRPHHALAIWSLGWIVGVLIAPFARFNIWSIGVGLALILLGLLKNLPPLTRASAILLFGLILGWWRHQIALDLFPTPPDPLPNGVVHLTGEIVSDPILDTDHQTFHFHIKKLDGESADFRAAASSWQLPVLSYGMEVEGDFRLSLPENRGQFDYVSYLAKDGIGSIANVAGEVSVVGAKPSLIGQLYVFRHFVDRQIKSILPGTSGGLLSGLLLGTKASLSDDFKKALQQSGTSHIVALSGFNITIIIAVMIQLFSFFRRRVQLVCSGVGILIFVLMCGAAGSVVRAAIMGSIFLLAGLWGRRQYIWNSLLLAIVIMTVINPSVLSYDVGFQLSLFATIGIVWLTPIISGPFHRWPSWLSEALTATIAASLFTLPILIYNFSGVSVVGLLANLLVVPVVPIAMAIGMVGLLISFFSPLGALLTLVVWLPLGWIEKVITTLGAWPAAFLPISGLPRILIVLYYAGLAITVYLLQHRENDKSQKSLALASR